MRIISRKAKENKKANPLSDPKKKSFACKIHTFIVHYCTKVVVFAAVPIHSTLRLAPVRAVNSINLALHLLQY